MIIEHSVLYNDPHFFAFNKPVGLLSQADNEHSENAWALAEEHLGQKLHLSNRLDRPVSGILLFSKSLQELIIPI